MTDDNKDQLRGKDLLVAYYDVDYDKNPKGSNYWRNRYGKIVFFVLFFFSPTSITPWVVSIHSNGGVFKYTMTV